MVEQMMGNDREDITLHRRAQQRELATPYAGNDLSEEEQLILELTEAKRSYSAVLRRYSPCWEQQDAARQVDYYRGLWRRLHPGQPDPPPWTPPAPVDSDAAERAQYYRAEVHGEYGLEQIVQSEIVRQNTREANPDCPPAYRASHPYDIGDLAERLGLTPRQVRRYTRDMDDLGRAAPAGLKKGRPGMWYSLHDLGRLKLCKMGQEDPGPETAPRADAE